MPARYYKGIPPADKRCPLSNTSDDMEYFVIEEIRDIKQMRGKTYLAMYFFDDALQKAGWLPPAKAGKIKQLNAKISELESQVLDLQNWRARLFEAITTEFQNDVSYENQRLLATLTHNDEVLYTQILTERESSEGLDSFKPDNESTEGAVPVSSREGA